LAWIAKSGKRDRLAIERWHTVIESLRLLEPYVGWMKEPLLRAQFTEWMKTAIECVNVLRVQE
jgi:hypothetical protein